MTGALVQQRCWNHELREAVCRCPGCGRHFCRECVTEHERRLLCVACLEATVRAGVARRHPGRALWTPAAALGGLLLSWLMFYIGGEILLEIAAHAEHTWPLR